MVLNFWNGLNRVDYLASKVSIILEKIPFSKRNDPGNLSVTWTSGIIPDEMDLNLIISIHSLNMKKVKSNAVKPENSCFHFVNRKNSYFHPVNRENFRFPFRKPGKFPVSIP